MKISGMCCRKFKIVAFLIISVTLFSFLTPLAVMAKEKDYSAESDGGTDSIPEINEEMVNDVETEEEIRDALNVLIYMIMSLGLCYITFFTCRHLRLCNDEYPSYIDFIYAFIKIADMFLSFYSTMCFLNGNICRAMILFLLMYAEIFFTFKDWYIIRSIAGKLEKWLYKGDGESEEDYYDFNHLQEGNQPHLNDIQQKPALSDRLEQDKELWIGLSDILDMTKKQLTHIACIKDQFHHLIIENEMEEIFSDVEDAIARIEKNMCRELNLCDYWMHIYEPDKKADFSAMKSMLKKVFTKNEKSINDTKVFILYLTEYIMQQYNSSNGEVSIGIYKQAIESLAGGSG